ncbi:hypothetical protein BXZ70DRAFT_1004706 [Cristinia sonorae]|uniref:Uncharacterized protein n=1 Tax=Cristinia sonorae TaxID=1940300 RepID=A0A8K0UWD4_9AGAR|nr:hypothetical protein BXZ70DRAFT_1004706 [Cristinia sonorae]
MPKDGAKYQLINIGSGLALGLGTDHHCAESRALGDEPTLNWTFHIDNEGRWKIKNQNHRYLGLKDTDMRNRWTVINREPMPTGWSVEIVDRKDPDKGVRIYYGDSTYLLQHPPETPNEFAHILLCDNSGSLHEELADRSWLLVEITSE